jgi:hypothetical protein
MRNRVVRSAQAALLIALSMLPASAKDAWKAELEEKLKSPLVLTKLGIDQLRVTHPGTLFVIQREGIGGQQAKDVTLSKVFVRDGTVAQAGGLMVALIDRKNARQFRVGERVYVSKISVQDNEIWYIINAVDTMEANLRGTTQQTRYKALLAFQFPKGDLETTEFAKVQASISDVLVSEQEQKASSAAPKTVELGQTMQQVEGSIGKPEKTINLGGKTVYVYKDIKITFVDGKVADVQ